MIANKTKSFDFRKNAFSKEDLGLHIIKGLLDRNPLAKRFSSNVCVGHSG